MVQESIWGSKWDLLKIRIMSGKGNQSAQRPSSARLSLGKMKSKQSPGGSISIRFNAASMEDDYDLDDDLSIGSGKPKVETVQFEIKKDDDVSQPVLDMQTEPSPEASSPVFIAASSEQGNVEQQAASSPKEETPSTGEKSLLSGLKERFQDRLPEPINAFIEKIEREKIKESSPDDSRKKLQKTESQESDQSTQMTPSASTDLGNIKRDNGKSILSSFKRDSFNESSRDKSRQGSVESEASEAGSTTHSEPVTIVEDYYDDDNAFIDDTYDKSQHIEKSSSVEQITTKQRASSLKRFIRPKDKSSPVKVLKGSMTLSGLLSSKSDDSIHSHTSGSNTSMKDEPQSEEFYDVHDHEEIPTVMEDKPNINTVNQIKENASESIEESLKNPNWQK